MALDTRHDEIAELCNRLTFVTWDRFIAYIDGTDQLWIYGWIAREDQRSDFVVLNFEETGEGVLTVGFTTSSSKRSGEIALLLFQDEADHSPCQRVDEVFGDLIVNKTTARQSVGASK